MLENFYTKKINFAINLRKLKNLEGSHERCNLSFNSQCKDNLLFDYLWYTSLY